MRAQNVGTEMPDSAARLERLPDILNVAETARFLRLGRNAAYEAIRRREIPSIRIGRRLLVPRQALERLLAGGDGHHGGNHGGADDTD